MVYTRTHFVLNNLFSCTLKLGSQYDAGAASIKSIMSVTRKSSFFYQSTFIPDIKSFDNLIGWTLANAGDATREQKSSLFQRHPDAHDTMLVQAS